jgi:processive 1,2-diacylglycerol beta-glucosyltransferase
MVFNSIIPGQEEDNVRYTAKQGVGIKAGGVKKSVEVVNKLFTKPQKITEMREKCKIIAKPDAARNIVDFIISQIN